MMNKKQGFTLIELLVVVLIIGILAAMALPAYFKAVERSRIAEADTLLGSTAQAQQRRYMKNNKYSLLFSGLDVAPTNVATSVFCTKGGTKEDGTASDCANGFAITLKGAASAGNDYAKGYAEAVRVGNSQYGYTLRRFYQSTKTSCIPASGNEADVALCADFCGTDNAASGCCNDGTEELCKDFTVAS